MYNEIIGINFDRPEALGEDEEQGLFWVGLIGERLNRGCVGVRADVLLDYERFRAVVLGSTGTMVGIPEIDALEDAWMSSSLWRERVSAALGRANPTRPVDSL